MKKLMTVIAAVAMSFGLFADEPAAKASHFISFETADACVDENGKLEKAGWEGDASVIDLVGSGYNYIGADARRTEFLGGDTNVKCLKLETGKEVVTCTPGGDTKDIFFDQVVKFTGYEEDPTVTGGKIAIWASAIEADDQAEPAVPGETNLYITCGTVAGEGTITPAEKILVRENIDIDAWHRVTIKSLGEVTKGGVAGFIVYIDGTQAVSTDAMGIVAEAQILDPFSSYNASGMLFPALASGAVTAVAYQGIGELDDVAIDDQGPQFARFVEGTVAAVPNATLLLTDAQGNVITPDQDGKFLAAPGVALTFAYEAKNGYFFKGGVLTQSFPGKAEQGAEFDFTNDLDAKVAVATYADEDSGETRYTDSLQQAFDLTSEGVTLMADITMAAKAAWFTIPSTFNGTFDLNGKKIERTADSDYVLDIVNGAKVTLVDNGETKGWIKGTPVASGNTTYPASLIRVKGKLTLKGAALQSDFCCVKVDEDPGVGEFNMKSGSLTVIGDFTGLTYAVMAWGPATIEGGNVSGNIRVMSDNSNKASKSGTVTLDDGNFDPFTVFFYAADTEVSGTAKISNDIAALFDVDVTDAKGWKYEKAAGDEYTTISLVKLDYAVTVQAGGVEKKYEDVDTALAEVEAYTKANPTETVLVTFDKAVTKENAYSFAAGATITISTDAATALGGQITTTWSLAGGDASFFLPVGNYKDVTLQAGYTLTFAGAIGEGSSVTAVTLTVPEGKQITLAATAEVKTETVLAYETFVVPDGYKLNKAGDSLITYSAVELETWTVTLAAIDETKVATFDANPKTVREDAESKAITLEATFQDGFELDYYTVDNVKIEGETFDIEKSVTVGVVAKATSTDPIDDPTELDEKGEANLEALKEALPPGANINTWAATVYADGKIPALKLNNSTPELIAAAAKYDLAVMAAPVEVKVEATETANCFKFTLSDADKANPLVAATKIQMLVQYTTALGEATPFTQSNDKAVAVALDNETVPTCFTATLTGKDTAGEASAAGFMKVEVK